MYVNDGKKITYYILVQKHSFYDVHKIMNWKTNDHT